MTYPRVFITYNGLSRDIALHTSEILLIHEVQSVIRLQALLYMLRHYHSVPPTRVPFLCLLRDIVLSQQTIQSIKSILLYYITGKSIT